jgi:uncharacterized membrane protein
VRLAWRVGAMAGFLAAMIEWVRFLFATAYHLKGPAMLNTVASVVVTLLFVLTGWVAVARRRPLAAAGYAGVGAGLVYGVLTAVAPAATLSGATLGVRALTYFATVVDSVLFGALAAVLGGVVGRLGQGRRGGDVR